NVAVVTGAGSRWHHNGNIYVGSDGAGNQLVVSNGGVVLDGVGFVGVAPTSRNNLAVVTGAGSLWTNQNELFVGASGGGNQLVVSNSATVFARLNLYIGSNPSSSTNNRVIVDGGTLRASNASGTGTLDVRGGTNVLNAGLIDVD